MSIGACHDRHRLAVAVAGALANVVGRRRRAMRDEGKGADPIRSVFWIIINGIENEGE